MGVGIGVKIRLFIINILGILLFLPGLLIIYAGFMEPDITADDTLALFFLGGLMALAGLLIFRVGKSMYRKAHRGIRPHVNTGMMTGMGMAHMYHTMDMSDDSGPDNDNADVDVDSGGYDDGGDVDIND